MIRKLISKLLKLFKINDEIFFVGATDKLAPP
jgi:hypothetical protein